MTFETSWADAEEVCFTHLLQATYSERDRNAFLGVLPHMMNVWMLKTGGTGGDEQTTWSPDIVSIHMPAEIHGQFSSRAKAQEFAMQVIKALPLKQDNVQNFRIARGGMPEIMPDAFDLNNEQKKYLLWVVSIKLDFVFSTGGRLES